MRPKVILFSSNRDTLPASIPYATFTSSELLKQEHPVVSDLINLAHLDVEKLKTDNRQKRHTLIEIAGQISTKKFTAFWKQNDIEFVFNIDTELASIFIRDKGNINIYRPEQRSEGFQWFLSFYLRLEASGREKNNIILVDEPGLFLHAKAQKDVLKVFEELSKTNQILFTTHSPYLIDPNHLNRVRLVVKKDYKTVIINSFHEGGADRETLTPITTAIGLDISNDLFFTKSDWNIVNEGVSDYYYLRGMIHFLKSSTNYEFPANTLIPCFGHTTVGLMTSFLDALGLKYKILLDKKDTEKTKNKLIRDGISDNSFLFAGTTRDESIEHLFSEDDRQNLGITDDYESKGIISRAIYEKIILGSYTPSSETITNFKNLLDKIKSEIPSDS